MRTEQSRQAMFICDSWTHFCLYHYKQKVGLSPFRVGQPNDIWELKAEKTQERVILMEFKGT